MMLSAAQKKEAIRVATEAIQNVIDQLSEQKEELATQLVENIAYLVNDKRREDLRNYSMQSDLGDAVYDGNPLEDVHDDFIQPVLDYVYEAFGVARRSIAEEFPPSGDL